MGCALPVGNWATMGQVNPRARTIHLAGTCQCRLGLKPFGAAGIRRRRQRAWEHCVDRWGMRRRCTPYRAH
jgi:hypothetical protein